MACSGCAARREAIKKAAASVDAKVRVVTAEAKNAGRKLVKSLLERRK